MAELHTGVTEQQQLALIHCMLFSANKTEVGEFLDTVAFIMVYLFATTTQTIPALHARKFTLIFE